ncbi:hypothetical protein Kpol_1018p186 [Vanderwaltozyma polyspora DSM 70294]|uniref:Glycosyltransferase HOC1 n=1 Tax=Vanderwaltozyma polyspora (strain ATCC 22028 / DSM 70294 / BCRC 21397 / CBS 2163 / NBRC 10782 / NRRL Y-8283 / UCD 57-17) TaxID=436907 RepID=A7TE26_VANPO|nr:uncharacterized protein Kpol_1018p186 [Vanderwaltozyma polyspora DSM 70294]EDO19646.1 hypothetical protein Kpol_1018p186 [Vanderwaltozyma polyspora DSM 70294]
MGKAKRNTNVKRLILTIMMSIIGLYGLMRFLNNHKSTDLQKILQNLPKEISQNVLQAASTQQKNDVDVIAKFEELFGEIKKNQEEQARQLERQRRVLERKIQKLKQGSQGDTLRERLAYTFEYDASKKFPAFIWQLSPFDDPREDRQKINGDSNEDTISLVKNSVRLWDDKNPGFVHEKLDDHVMGALVHHFYSSTPEVIKAYEALPSKLLKIDFFKYLILLARGGIYADIDTEPLQPIPNWLPEHISPSSIGLIVGIEHDAKTQDWKNYYVRRLQFGTWIIQCKPGHPVLREIVARITEETLKRKTENGLNVNLRNDLMVMKWTGSGIWTDVIFSYFNDYLKSGINKKVNWKEFTSLNEPKLLSDILVYPKYSFDVPKDAKDNNNEKSYYLVSHRMKKTWKALPNGK